MVDQYADELKRKVTIPVTELFVPNGQGGREWNDLVVAISSALYEGGTPFCPVSINNLSGILMGNHSGIKTKQMASEIVAQIKSDWAVQ